MPDEKKISSIAISRFSEMLDGDLVPRNEFLKAFEKVLDFAKDVKKKNADDFKGLSEEISSVAKNTKDITTADFNELKRKLENMSENQRTAMDKLFNDKIDELNIRISQIRDGQDGIDADEKRIIKSVLKQVKFPELEISGADIRDYLEALEDEEKIDVSAIKGLEEFIKKHKEPAMGGGLRESKSGIETPVGTINGSNKAFTVAWKPEFVTLNGQAIYESDGYTLSSASGVLTITFDSAPLTGGVLRSHYKES